MDMMHAYYNGYNNRRKELTNDEKAFMEGFRFCTNALKDDWDFILSMEETGIESVDKMIQEIGKNSIKQMHEHLEYKWCEHLISFLDAREDEATPAENWMWNQTGYIVEEPEDFEEEKEQEANE